MSSTPYDRQTSFALFSAENPTAQQSGTSLDAEFNAVKIAVDDTQQNLALIQDDDGVLKRGSVGKAQFDSSVSLGFGPPTQWVAGHLYTAAVDTVFNASIFYIAKMTHTSGVSFDPTKFDVLANFTTSAVIPDGSITNAKLADGAIGAAKLADGSVSTAKLASLAVTTSKLADSAVTLAKMATSIPVDLAKLILPAGLGPLPFSGLALPAGWDWADGGVLLSSTLFPTLRASLITDGFPYGQDGSGNPKKPDARGRVPAGADQMSAGFAAGRLTATSGMTGSGPGSTGGAQTHTLATAELPPYTPAGGITNGQVKIGGSSSLVVGQQNAIQYATNAGAQVGAVNSTLAITQDASTFAGTPAPGQISTPFAVIQPTITFNMIIKAH